MPSRVMEALMVEFCAFLRSMPPANVMIIAVVNIPVAYGSQCGCLTVYAVNHMKNNVTRKPIMYEGENHFLFMRE